MNIRCQERVYLTLFMLGLSAGSCCVSVFISALIFGWKDWPTVVFIGAGTAFLIAYIDVYRYIYPFVASE